MTTFNPTFDWDTDLPPSISSLDENDFLLLLQKQFPVVNTGDHPISPSALSKEKPVVGTNPQSLPKFPLPSSNSPLSSDSSPSPPSPNDDGSASGSVDNNYKRSESGDDEHHKRKASGDNFDDDIGGQPSSKTQHTDVKSKKVNGNVRRKSSGGERTQDESRLLKRKEQNRAAQRAFRERKEKHVKDLEDKVAQLEAKTESQEVENENLRDMLSRLQNENMVLKQTAFTFSVPPSSNNAPGNNTNKHNAPTPERRNSTLSSAESINNLLSNNAVPGPSSVPASAGSSIRTASTHDSPSSIFETFEGFSGLQNPDVSTAPSTVPASSSNNPNNSISSHDLDTIAYFGAPGPFTTISSNPMFTSYRDPMLSMNAFASFNGWDGDVAMSGGSSVQGPSNSGLDGLFGDQFSGLIPFSNDFLNGDASSGNSPSGSSAAARLSPVVHHKAKPAEHPSETCPKTKEDIERLVATGGKSTFGTPPPSVEEQRNSTIVSPASGPPGRRSDYDTAVDQAFGMPPKKEFSENCNIDDLCLEMQRKARCSYAATTWSQ